MNYSNPTPEELAEAIKTTSWDISVEVSRRDGTSTSITGSFLFREGTISFKTSHPDFELELDEVEDYPEDEEPPSKEIIKQVLAHVEKGIKDRLESDTDSEIDSAEYDAADEENLREGGVMRYHGVSWHDFL
jgi:hypothetical protein